MKKKKTKIREVNPLLLEFLRDVVFVFVSPERSLFPIPLRSAGLSSAIGSCVLLCFRWFTLSTIPFIDSGS